MYYLINKQTKEHIPNPTVEQRFDASHDDNWDIVLADDDGWIPNSSPGVLSGRPLPDNHKCIAKFIDGAYLTPTRARMWMFDKTLVAYKPIFEDEQITLQPGDYVSTENMTESEYHDVARAFMWAGADSLEYPNTQYFEEHPLFGWLDNQNYYNQNYNLQGLYHGGNDSTRSFLTGRLLTIEQVINATNSGTQASSKNLSKTRGVKPGEMMMDCKGSVKEGAYWNGQEWPAPIGTKVEAQDLLGSWREGVVGYQVNDSDSGKMVLVDFGDDWVVVSQLEIRPIDTQKEEWLQKASEVVNNIVGPDGAILHNLYNALKSGELSIPKD